MATNIPVAVGELIDTPTINTWARGYLRKTTAKTVNTLGPTTFTDLLNSEFTLAAGAMGTDKIVRLTAWGDWKQNGGAAKDAPLFRLQLGGTTLIDTDYGANNTIANSSLRYGWRIVCEIQNLGATNSQWVTFDGRFMGLASATQQVRFATGNGATITEAVGTISYVGAATAAVDTTVSCALVLKVANAFNHANYETKLYGALVEVI